MILFKNYVMAIQILNKQTKALEAIRSAANNTHTSDAANLALIQVLASETLEETLPEIEAYKAREMQA